MYWRAGEINHQYASKSIFAKQVLNFLECFFEDISIVVPMNRYLDIKDSSEFQRYTSSCQTHKEADEGMEEMGKKEMKEIEVKEEEVVEEMRQHGWVRIFQNQILKSISSILQVAFIYPPGGN